MAKKTSFPPLPEMLSLVKGGELTVKVTPNAGDNSISLPGDNGPAGILLVRVTATPENGKANAAVLKLLAKALGLPKTSLAIVRGGNARTKIIAIPD
ncbi:MAG: hypothetical protein ACI9TB_001235 [Parasphingorhabdus sp.]|jgi:uncharacterized protein YggU (UPF0235/DUF167 family)|uniref:DUF167 domain-containing protein n=1 Tax=Parasphingorhabdus sp. TaxID=2709688 RepID=UPI002B277CB8|nr:DUF167 domain-containing protein [Parasphingorhabdus sp.]|tara:strand:+ start:2928 stop:3218 length:291 start_codon:yes stop_codon:yes gene_type:complete